MRLAITVRDGPNLRLKVLKGIKIKIAFEDLNYALQRELPHFDQCVTFEF